MPRLLHFLLLASLLLLAGPLHKLAAQTTAAQESEPSRKPVLRIETGMHTAGIKRLGVDRAGRFLVTVADDKTVRLWELASGRLLRILRPPIGDGDMGKLYAVAISPDGDTIAASGWTSEDGLHESVYIFDREGGRVLRRLPGLPNVVNNLAFSPDGSLLVASLYGTHGVRVWRSSDWSEVGRDTDYGDSSYGADFDRAGRLVTGSWDGSLRLYDRGMHLLTKRKVPDGGRPYHVRFSPDGHKIAVGYDDTTKVSVVSGDTLAPLYSADTTGVDNGNLICVAWSVDGAVLYAGGSYQASDGARAIRHWNDAGRGRYADTPAAYDTIRDIATLDTGGIVYGGFGPVWGIIDANHRQTRRETGQVADYRAMLEGFLTDATASTVRFGYELFGKQPAAFSVTNRTLTLDPPTGGLHPPRTDAPGLSVTDWYNTYKPLLNSKPLKIDEYELSRCLAIAPNGERFLLGADFNLRLFDRTGQEVWSVSAPAAVWGVNISSDGRRAVAAYGDGTIRWYRMADGKELLAFFPHADKKRWVIWTPSGYYDASPGAEELIGWHVNNGRAEAADFFPVGQFRSTYYRPDLIIKVLPAGDEQLALKEADEDAGRRTQQADVARLLPPVVEIVAPADGAALAANEIIVRYNLRTPSGEPVTEVRALVDGRPAAAERGLSLQGQSGSARELRVIVPEGESQVSIIAANRFTTSVPATVHVRAQPAARPPVAVAPATPAGGVAPGGRAGGDQFEIRPRLYVLAVGVSDYADPKLKLGFPAKDAQDFASAWARQKDTLYRDVVVKLLTDDKATKDEVLDGLDWIRKETTSKDVAVVLFAGHGINDQNGVYYFLPFNADTNKLLRTGVSFSDIKNSVAAIAGKTLFFIDTCHSGNVLGTRRGIGNDMNGVVNELASTENGAIVFAASTGSQYSLEKVEWNNGAFTKAVVEGLTGRADYTGRGRITVNMLDLYISERVKELTAGTQTPTTAKPQTVPDFPVALKR